MQKEKNNFISAINKPKQGSTSPQVGYSKQMRLTPCVDPTAKATAITQILQKEINIFLIFSPVSVCFHLLPPNDYLAGKLRRSCSNTGTTTAEAALHSRNLTLDGVR